MKGYYLLNYFIFISSSSAQGPMFALQCYFFLGFCLFSLLFVFFFFFWLFCYFGSPDVCGPYVYCFECDDAVVLTERS